MVPSKSYLLLKLEKGVVSSPNSLLFNFPPKKVWVCNNKICSIPFFFPISSSKILLVLTLFKPCHSRPQWIQCTLIFYKLANSNYECNFKIWFLFQDTRVHQPTQALFQFDSISSPKCKCYYFQVAVEFVVCTNVPCFYPWIFFSSPILLTCVKITKTSLNKVEYSTVLSLSDPQQGSVPCNRPIFVSDQFDMVLKIWILQGFKNSNYVDKNQHIDSVNFNLESKIRGKNYCQKTSLSHSSPKHYWFSVSIHLKYFSSSVAWFIKDVLAFIFATS